MCNKPFGIYPAVIQFISYQYKTQEICVKAVDTCPFVFDCTSDWSKTQEMRDEIVLKDHFILKHCLQRYNNYAIIPLYHH